jgi:hypothetical protein
MENCPISGRTCQMMDRFGDHGLMGQDGIHRLPWMDGFTWCMSISSFPRRFRNGIGAPGGFPLLVFLFFSNVGSRQDGLVLHELRHANGTAELKWSGIHNYVGFFCSVPVPAFSVDLQCE